MPKATKSSSSRAALGRQPLHVGAHRLQIVDALARGRMPVDRAADLDHQIAECRGISGRTGAAGRQRGRCGASVGRIAMKLRTAASTSTSGSAADSARTAQESA